MNTHLEEKILDIEKKLSKQVNLNQEDEKIIIETITALDNGQLRIAEKKGDKWVTHAWLKKAILFYFKITKNDILKSEDINYFDKIPIKKWTSENGVRVVPPAVARFGSHIEKGCILMPSFINIGAYVGAGTMADTWATVGSCAQIGRNVHLSGGVGIGGVLEPAQASPVIIEDDVFIGSRCIVVEGAHIEENSVLGAGVTITASTKIIDVSGSTEKRYTGRVPKNSVVIPGSYKKQFPAGEFSVNCALIIGQRNENTDKKTSLNQVLRDFEISV